MTAIYLPPNATDEERAEFFDQIMLHIDEVTLTRKRMVLKVDQDGLRLERQGRLVDAEVHYDD